MKTKIFYDEMPSKTLMNLVRTTPEQSTELFTLMLDNFRTFVNH